MATGLPTPRLLGYFREIPIKLECSCKSASPKNFAQLLSAMFEAPAEIQLLGIYLPPLFLVCLLGLIFAVATTQVLNWTGLSRLFWHPPLAFFAVWVLASSLIGLVAIAP
jgi:hypothetical protein